MAKKEKNKGGNKKEAKDQKSTAGKPGILTWIIMVIIIASLTGSGFFLGRIFAGSKNAEKSENSTDHQTSKEKSSSKNKPDSKNTWYYDLEPIVANLNEPGAMRYVRASITLEIYSTWDQIEAKKVLEMQKPPLRSWLAIYLAGLTTENATGIQNQKRIQLEILDSFNGILFPDAKPQIKQVLFKQGLTIQ